MTTSLSLVIGLLTTALSLLTIVQQNPNLPLASRDNARQIAESAIVQATSLLSSPSTTTSSTTIPHSTSTSTTTEPSAIPKPKVRITANPSVVKYAATAEISWVATDSLSCTLGSSPVLLSVIGSRQVTPTEPTMDWKVSNKNKYSITCTGSGGSVYEEAVVTVKPWEPPSGYRVLPYDQCTKLTAPCITGPGFGKRCERTGCGIGG